jgi:hypothetical protein
MLAEAGFSRRMVSPDGWPLPAPALSLLLFSHFRLSFHIASLANIFIFTFDYFRRIA